MKFEDYPESIIEYSRRKRPRILHKYNWTGFNYLSSCIYLKSDDTFWEITYKDLFNKRYFKWI